MLKILSLFNAQVLQILLQMFINFESTIMVTNGRKGGVQYIESVIILTWCKRIKGRWESFGMLNKFLCQRIITNPIPAKKRTYMHAYIII